MSKLVATSIPILILLGLCACSKDSDTEKYVLPTVKVEAGEATPASVSFTITATDAKSVSYLVIRAGDTLPDSLTLITNGKKVDVSSATPCTEYDLEPNVEYVVLAAARNGSRISAPASVRMVSANAPKVAVTPVEATRTSLSFTIAAEGAEKVSYLVVASDETLPDADAILAKGKTADPQAKQTYTQMGLNPGTGYVVAAASSSGGFGFAAEPIAMQTLKERYEPGDLYQSGSTNGIVYKISEDGRSGMIFSLDETTERWSISLGMSGSESESDGMANMEVIQSIGRWMLYFPSFKWCNDHNGENGSGWYLPAMTELEELYNAFNGGSDTPDPTARNRFNQNLRNLGVTPIYEGRYWSSTDLGMGGQYIGYFNFRDGHRGSYGSWLVHHIRAVKAF